MEDGKASIDGLSLAVLGGTLRDALEKAFKGTFSSGKRLTL